MRSQFTALVFALLAVAPAGATPLDDLIKPEAGNSACFARVYDAAHLRSHPKQRTAAMMVWLSYDKASTAQTGPGMALAIMRRGDPTMLHSQGGCAWDERANSDTSDNRLIKAYLKDAGAVCQQSARPDVFDAVSAMEGGALIVDRGRDRDTLMVYLDEVLIMVKRADRARQLNIKFGPADRVFMLTRADVKNCEVIKEAVTTPERKR